MWVRCGHGHVAVVSCVVRSRVAYDVQESLRASERAPGRRQLPRRPPAATGRPANPTKTLYCRRISVCRPDESSVPPRALEEPVTSAQEPPKSPQESPKTPQGAAKTPPGGPEIHFRKLETSILDACSSIRAGASHVRITSRHLICRFCLYAFHNF